MAEAISTFKLTLLLMLGIIVMGSNSFVLSPILSDVATDLDTSPVIVARVISAFGAATAVSSFLFGRMIDQLGERRVLMVGAAMMVVSLLGCAVSTTWVWLAASQAVIGLAVGMMLPACYASATANAPDGQGPRVLGRVISGWGVALVIGVPFSAFVSDLAGWRATFAALAGFASLSLIGFLQLPKRPDVLYRTPPVSPVQAVRIAGVPSLLLTCLTFMTAFYGIYAFLGDHLRTTLDLTAGAAGVIVLFYGAGFALASVADATVHRLGAFRMLPVAMLIAGIVYLVLIPATQGYYTAAIVAFVWGFINHICINLVVLLLSDRDDGARGTLMGLQTSVTYTSVFLGPLVLGALYPIGFHAMAIVAAVLLALGAATAVSFWRSLGASATQK